MNVEIVRVSFLEKQILNNLLKMYCYEWSQYTKFDVNDQGEYEFEHHLDDYWKKENHFPFFVKVNGMLAGFVLIDNDFALHLDYDYAMAEFFIMHKYRRGGIGRYVAKTIFDMFPGKWEIGEHPRNVTSVKFWSSVVDEYTQGKYEIIDGCPKHVYHDGSYGNIISFENKVCS